MHGAAAVARVKPLLLTFDVEEFDWPLAFRHPISLAEQIEVTCRGLDRLLPILEEHGAPATFFVTGVFAEARPDVVRALAHAGHEVAVHGLEHGDDYATLEPALATERMRRARALVSAAAGVAASGVRTPRLRPCPAGVLRQAGFEYDATPHPTWVPGRYNGLRLPRRPWSEDGLLRIPISVLPWVRVPVSWIWYRTAGSTLGGAAARAAGAASPYVHLYFHPWEAVPLDAYGIPRSLRIGTGGPFLGMLEDLLTSARRGYAATTIGDLVRKTRPVAPRSAIP